MAYHFMTGAQEEQAVPYLRQAGIDIQLSSFESESFCLRLKVRMQNR